MGKLSTFAATSESPLLEMQTFCSERFSATDPTLLGTIVIPQQALVYHFPSNMTSRSRGC